MLAFIFKEVKILKSIIVFNSVYMVTAFFGFKITPYMFFHNKPMFTNITRSITKGMIGVINHNVTKGGFKASSYPSPMPFAFLKLGWNRCSFSLFAFTNFLSKFRRVGSSFINIVPFYESTKFITHTIIILLFLLMSRKI